MITGHRFRHENLEPNLWHGPDNNGPSGPFPTAGVSDDTSAGSPVTESHVSASSSGAPALIRVATTSQVLFHAVPTSCPPTARTVALIANCIAQSMPAIGLLAHLPALHGMWPLCTLDDALANRTSRP